MQAEQKTMVIISTGELNKPLLLINHTTHSSVQTIHETTQDIDREVKRLRQLGDEQEYQTVVDWLTPVNYTLQQNDFIAQQ